MLTIHPPAFIETGGCDGPRYIRGQPSRETEGVTIADIQDKYIPEFTLPFRNVKRYIKEVANNWDRLDTEQRDEIRKSFEQMNLMPKEMLGLGQLPQEGQGTLECAMQYILQDPQNIGNILDESWTHTSVRKSINKWSMQNSFALHCNWLSGLLFFLILIIVLVLGVIIGKSIKN